MTQLHEEATSCSAAEQRPGAVLVVLVIGTFLAPLDSSIVNIALPSISAQFGVSLTDVSWVTTAYLLTTAALLLSMGRVGDTWGLRRLYVTGLLVFGAGSAACAMSGSLEMLVASRVAQAVGASMLFAAGPALVSRTFPPNRRGWALGYVSLAVSAGLTVGPALGGLLVGTFGWPSIFLINIPLSIAVAAVAWRLLVDECTVPERFDLLGAFLSGAALGLLIFGLLEADQSGLVSIPVLGPIACSAILGFAFIRWERRAPSPMVDLRLFESAPFSAGVAAATLAYLGLFAITFTMPFYLLRVQGVDPRAAGAILTVTPLAMAVLAPTAGRLSDQRGSRVLATLGAGLLAAGLLLASFLNPSSALWLVPLSLFVIGSGMAIFQTPNTAGVMRATPRSRVGVGSAFIAEARNVGMSLGIAVTAAIVGAAIGGSGLPSGEGPLPADVAQLFSDGMATALRVGAAVVLCAAALSWVGRRAESVEQGNANT